VSEWIAEVLEPSGVTVLPLTPSAWVRAIELSAFHRDPFDRLIMATSIELQARLASLDSMMAGYPEVRDILL
jgi:PIN domain nuclease of toxin-antitoxin system